MADSDTLFARLCASRYALIKANHPGEGRRKRKLRVAEEFWSLSADDKKKLVQDLPAFDPNAPYDFLTDGDPADEVTDKVPGEGLIVRTDYSNETAWTTFCDKVREAQEELFSDSQETPEEADMAADADESDADEAMDEDQDEDDEEEEGPPVLFHIINPSDPSDRLQLSHISNLAALRLLNDVSIRKAPLPPFGSGIKRIKPPNRLIDHDGWQEIYTGKTIWVYDATSNQDGCARLVSQKSAEAPYGTATGDSWRAKATHLPELQANIASGAIKIDFGGMDRWDHNERQRNLQEATLPMQ